MKKLTNVTALEMVLGMEMVIQNQELFDKLTQMKNQFEKKNSSQGLRKPTKTQQENEVLLGIVLGYLQEVKDKKTITELTNEVAELNGLSGQKVSALLKKLVDTEKVIKTLEKRKTYFQAK